MMSSAIDSDFRLDFPDPFNYDFDQVIQPPDIPYLDDDDDNGLLSLPDLQTPLQKLNSQDHDPFFGTDVSSSHFSSGGICSPLGGIGGIGGISSTENYGLSSNPYPHGLSSNPYPQQREADLFSQPFSTANYDHPIYDDPTSSCNSVDSVYAPSTGSNVSSSGSSSSARENERRYRMSLIGLTDEEKYRRTREQNNIASSKYRSKRKQQKRSTEQQLNDSMTENRRLEKKVQNLESLYERSRRLHRKANQMGLGHLFSEMSLL